MINDIEKLLNKYDDRDNRISWDTYFSCISLLISARSPCKRLRVGCVLVYDNRIISTGYNGFISGLQHESIVRNGHEIATIHAEQNAINDAAKRGVSVNNCIAYVSHYPCVNCAKTLISSGINKIIYRNDYKNDEIAKTLFNNAKIKITKIEEDALLKD